MSETDFGSTPDAAKPQWSRNEADVPGEAHERAKRIENLQDAIQWKARAESLAARVTALEAALKRYGGHEGDCPASVVYHPSKPTLKRPRCTCGFEAALRGPAEGEG